MSTEAHIAADLDTGGLPVGPAAVLHLLAGLSRRRTPGMEGKPSDAEIGYTTDAHGNTCWDITPEDILPVKVTRAFLSKKFDGASKQAISGWINLLAGQPNISRSNPDLSKEDREAAVVIDGKKVLVNGHRTHTTLKTPMIFIESATGELFRIRLNLQAITAEERSAYLKESGKRQSVRGLRFPAVEWVECAKSIPARGTKHVPVVENPVDTEALDEEHVAPPVVNHDGYPSQITTPPVVNHEGDPSQITTLEVVVLKKTQNKSEEGAPDALRTTGVDAITVEAASTDDEHSKTAATLLEAIPSIKATTDKIAYLADALALGVSRRTLADAFADATVWHTGDAAWDKFTATTSPIMVNYRRSQQMETLAW